MDDQPKVIVRSANTAMQDRIGTLHTIAVRAEELITIVLNGETRLTEGELDAFEALDDALSHVTVETD